ILSCHSRIFSSLHVPISLSVLPEALRRGLHPMPSWYPIRPTALAVPRSRYSTRLWLASWKRFWHHSKITSGMYRASSRRSFDPFSIVACSLGGRSFHTKYYLQNLPERVEVTRRHHPLFGSELEVVRANQSVLTIRLANGSTMKMPRAWTN